MGYLDTFDRAKKAAIELADDLQPSDTSALIFTNNRAKVSQTARWQKHRRIQTALTGARLTNYTTDYLNAIQSADEILGEAEIGSKADLLRQRFAANRLGEFR